MVAARNEKKIFVRWFFGACFAFIRFIRFGFIRDMRFGFIRFMRFGFIWLVRFGFSQFIRCGCIRVIRFGEDGNFQGSQLSVRLATFEATFGKVDNFRHEARNLYEAVDRLFLERGPRIQPLDLGVGVSEFGFGVSTPECWNGLLDSPACRLTFEIDF